MADFNLGTVTAYGYARDKGYTGTEAEFAELMASYAQVAEDAAESAEQAAQSATTASTKASEAAASATAAASSKTAAETAQGGAETAATTATTKAGEATTAATTATNKATEATTAATTATGKATEAAGSATTATTKAGEASTSATNAAASATRAQEILNSIPEDYSQLSDDVSDLKDGLTAVEDDVDALNTEGGIVSPSLTWTGGKYINDTTNAITNGNAQLYITDYIRIPESSKHITVKNVVKFPSGWTVAFYDSNKSFISGVMKTTTFVTNPNLDIEGTPVDAQYMIVGHYDYNNLYPKENVSVDFKKFPRIADIETNVSLLSDTLELDKKYNNVLEGATSFADNTFINQSGNVVYNPNFCLIDGFYPVKPNTVYKLYRGEPPLYSNAGHNWTFWDSNKSFISYTLSGAPVTSPENAAFLRFGVYISSTGSATHADFDPTKVIITEDGNPFFDDIFIKTPARPTFNGLKWIGIGDSITEDNFRATYHYWSYIAAETGLNFVNMGVSGTGYKAEGSGDKAFYKRIPSMATDADVITIFGGVNDVVLSSATIGTETDTGTETICGCVNTTLDAIETLYPAHMPIGIISPLPCYCSDTTVNIYPYQQPNDDTCRMAQFVEQLALICKHRGIPFLDLFHQSNLRPWHQECNAKYFSCESAKTGDGLHPNGHGHRLFYRQIMDFVSKIAMQ